MNVSRPRIVNKLHIMHHCAVFCIVADDGYDSMSAYLFRIPHAAFVIYIALNELHCVFFGICRDNESAAVDFHGFTFLEGIVKSCATHIDDTRGNV